MSCLSEASKENDIPSLTICIPTYNRSGYLRQAINSILPGASKHQIAISVADNSDNDESEAVINDLRASYTNIKYHRHKRNVGMDRNIESLVRSVTTDYFWLFSDDDCVEPEAIDTVMSLIGSLTDIDLFVLNTAAYDQDLRVLLDPNVGKINYDLRFESLEPLLAQYSWYNFVCALVFRTRALNGFDFERYYDSRYAQVGMMFHLRGEKAFFVAKPLIRYRSQNTSWSTTYLEVELKYWPRTIKLLPNDRYSRRAKVSAIEGVVRRFLRPTNLIGMRLSGILSLRKFLFVVFPYFWNAKKTSANNWHILIVSFVLLCFPVSFWNALWSMKRRRRERAIQLVSL